MFVFVFVLVCVCVFIVYFVYHFPNNKIIK